MTGEYFKYPLRLTKRSGAEWPGTDPMGDLYETLLFRPNLHGDYECMACAEAGNEWTGSDPARHGREHQMGLDYAHVLLKKHRDMTDLFRLGFEAAKKGAILCAQQSMYWGNCIRGCKAVQHSIEFMNLMDADRHNLDGTLKPEVYVEYDRAKHGPIVNGKVKV